jgi:cell division protein FtsW
MADTHDTGPGAATPHSEGPALADARATQGRRRTLHLHVPMLVLVLVGGLLALGMITLFSASAYAKSNNPYFYIERQLLAIGVAAVAGFVVALTPLSLIRRFVWWFAALILALLAATLTPGIGLLVKGSRRWIDFGPMNLQASELAKVAIVFVLAHYLASNQSRIQQAFRGFLVPMAIIAVPCALIIRQPDFGTAALCGVLGMTVLFLAGAPYRFLVPTALAGLLLFAIKIYLDPVRLERITSFLNLQNAEIKMGGGYQLTQAILAFGAGGVYGVGVGNGRQQLAFLPEAHNDFILAITGEEMGLFATLATVLLFLGIFAFGLVQIRRTTNLFHYLLLCGCFCAIAFQAIINLGVVTGLFPTKGMSLPFVSYGGSNLLLMGVVIGILFNVQRSSSRIAELSGDRTLRDLPA